MDISRDDYNLVIEIPERGFSPARNKAVIEGVIRHNQQLAKSRAKEWHDGLEMRADAAASFYNYKTMGGEQSLEGYFGKALEARIWGERFVERMRLQEARYKAPNGNGMILL